MTLPLDITLEKILAFANSSRRCIVLRGVSGSGKSTIARAVSRATAAKIHSADNFFLDKQGNYSFNPSKLGEAHAVCLKSFLAQIQNGNGVCVVDNTNTTIAEFAPYVAFASAYGWETIIVTVRTDPKVAAARNEHGVPAAGVEAQASRMQQNDALIPPFWKHYDFGI